MRRTMGLSLLVTAALATGCKGGDDDGDTDTMDMVGCADDERAMTYGPGLSRSGDADLFRFELVSSDPAPPAKGDNVWVIHVRDMSSGDVPGAAVSATALMPDHGHGTSVVPTVTEGDPGVYTLDPINLFMAGLWEVTVEASSGGDVDQAVFTFCIEG